MWIKNDYMGNDQLLPAYNVQFGMADEYIAVADAKYRDKPFRAVDVKIDTDGLLRCPAGQFFHFQYRQNVKGNQYGCQEEVCQCEDCTDCTYASQFKKTGKNKTIRLNQELTSMHKQVVDNLESIHGALLRMNRSIQSEGTFGRMKNKHRYKRIVRKGMKQVRLDIFLVSIGHNLYKYHNKKYA